MSRTFSMKSGSVESLKVSSWCGFKAKARQMRLTADWLMPVASASERVDQWVASRRRLLQGLCDHPLDPRLEIVRGLPGRGSSCKPSNLWMMNRLRHLATV